MSVTLTEVPGLGNNLTRPAGDPGALRAAAQKFTASQDALQVRQSDLRALMAGTVPEDWTGEAAKAFSYQVELLLEEFPTAVEACQRAAVALNTYADALEEAQAQAGRALSAAGDLRERAGRWEREWAAGPPADLSGPEADRLRATQAQDFQAEASAIQTTLAGANEAAAAAADDARREFAAITELASQVPTNIDAINHIKTATDPIALTAAVRDARVGLNAFDLIPSLTPLVSSYQRTVGPVLNTFGEGHPMTRNAENLWRYMVGQRRTASPLTSLAGGIAQTFGKGRQSISAAAVAASDIAAKLRPISQFAGKALGPIGIIADGKTVFEGSDLEGAWGVVDRVMAGVGVVSSGIGTYVALSGFVLTPPGAIALAVVGGIGAAWGIGKWVVQNHEEIAEFMVDRWEDTTEFFDAAGDVAADFIQDPGGTVGKAADTVGDALEDVGDAALGGFKQIGGWLTP